MKLRAHLRTLPGAQIVKKWLVRRYATRQFKREFNDFKKLSLQTSERAQGFNLSWEDRLPFMEDRTVTTGFDAHYIYHCAWAARAVANIMPTFHIDISSSLYFATMLSAFVPVKFFDYRPAKLNLPGLESDKADLCRLAFADGSVSSISCMHVVEHVGLGRYGEPLDPSGDLKAMAELKRVLAPGGSLLFVVPVGQPRIVFNAHRIYSCRQIREQFAGLNLKQLTLIPDDANEVGIILEATDAMVDKQRYGCGCFWFSK